MMFLIFVFALALIPGPCHSDETPKPEPNDETVSIRSLVEFLDILDSVVSSEEEENLLQEYLCGLSDEQWHVLEPLIARYMVKAYEANNVTGSFNYTRLVLFMSQEQFNYFVASECDEEYNLQPTMQSKIGTVGKGYLLRYGGCYTGMYLKREQSCNRTELDLDRSHAKKSKKGHSKRNHSKKDHSKRSRLNRSHLKKNHNKREHSKDKN